MDSKLIPININSRNYVLVTNGRTDNGDIRCSNHIMFRNLQLGNYLLFISIM